jgi:hypothetical protein
MSGFEPFRTDNGMSKFLDRTPWCIDQTSAFLILESPITCKICPQAERNKQWKQPDRQTVRQPDRDQDWNREEEEEEEEEEGEEEAKEAHEASSWCIASDAKIQPKHRNLNHMQTNKGFEKKHEALVFSESM